MKNIENYDGNLPMYKILFGFIAFFFLSGCSTVAFNSPDVSKQKLINDGSVSSVQNGTVYENQKMGISLRFSPGWLVLTGGQIKARQMSLGFTDKALDAKVMHECEQSLFCAILPPTKQQGFSQVSMEIIPGDNGSFEDMKYTAFSAAKRLWPASFSVNLLADVNVNGKKFAHIVESATANGKTILVDNYLTKYDDYFILYRSTTIGENAASFTQAREVLNTLKFTKAQWSFV